MIIIIYDYDFVSTLRIPSIFSTLRLTVVPLQTGKEHFIHNYQNISSLKKFKNESLYL